MPTRGTAFGMRPGQFDDQVLNAPPNLPMFGRSGEAAARLGRGWRPSRGGAARGDMAAGSKGTQASTLAGKRVVQRRAY